MPFGVGWTTSKKLDAPETVPGLHQRLEREVRVLHRQEIPGIEQHHFLQARGRRVACG